MGESNRADKWMWCVRLFKTRTLAAEACRGGKVKLNGSILKPSKELKAGDELRFKTGAITKTVRVKDFPKSRISAKQVPAFIDDLTPASEYERLKTIKETERPFFYTGKGRPTKKDRRKIENFI